MCAFRTLSIPTLAFFSRTGYDETAKMVAESAVCLALQRDSLAAKGGVLTPAAAMGETLIQRLHAKGLTFETLEK